MSDEEKEERFKRFISRKCKEALVSRSKLGENPALIAEGTLLELKQSNQLLNSQLYMLIFTSMLYITDRFFGNTFRCSRDVRFTTLR